MSQANATELVELDQLKAPPYSLEAEQSVLGGLMLDNSLWDDVIGQLTENDFYRRDHRLIFKVMRELTEQRQPLDAVTLVEALDKRSELESAGGLVYLGNLVKNVPSVANIPAYAAIVRERSVLRQLIKVASDVADSVYNPQGRTSVELLDFAERQIFAIAEQQVIDSGPRSLKSLLAASVDRIGKLFEAGESITGQACGFADLDGVTSGLQAGDMIVIAGRPSMGKTTFAMNIAENVIMNGNKPVLVYSMEMPAESLALRMLSSLGRVSQTKVRSGKLDEQDWPRITSAVSMLSERNMLIDDSAGLTPAELRARSRRVAREQGQLGLVVVDYLQLMKVPELRDNRVAEISEISRSLKALAKELKCPVLALSQLNRGLEQRPNKRPVMSDLRESGAIEQDADLVVFIYRDEVYNPESQDKGTAEIIIAKHRNGPTGMVKLVFRGEYLRFEDLAQGYKDY
jgi:replicative DNA helicase